MKTAHTPKNLIFMLRALRYRNYRLFFGGQILSLVGSWMTSTASAWLVYRLTGSAWYLGMVGFAAQFPSLLAPLAGVFVDRWNQHRLLKITQTLSMLQSFMLAYLAITHRINMHWIFGLNIFQGLVNAFDMPCRQSFMVKMIEDKHDLPNAIALNSSMVNAARLVGPSVAGLVIAAWSEGWCFFIDGVSYLAVIGALLAMRLPAAAAPREEKQAWAALSEGWSYTFGSRPIRSIIALLAVICLVGIPYTVLLPVIAGNILHGGPKTLGLLMTASGCGALAAALWLAGRKTVLGLGRVISLSAAVFGSGLILFSFSRQVWSSAVLMALLGFAFMSQVASSNTILQTIVEDDKRGRVMSFFMVAFLGTAPIGNLIAGTLADRIGVLHTVRIGGFCCLLGALWFLRNLPALRQAVRPIYARMGILPEFATGLQQAAALTNTPAD